jgi:hypothetical protein
MADYHEIGVGMQAACALLAGFAGCGRGAGANSPTHGRSRPRSRGSRFRVQGAGQYRSAAPRPHRLCADRLRPFPARHEIEEYPHRTPDVAAVPVFFLAHERNFGEEAWPGDIIGIPNHGSRSSNPSPSSEESDANLALNPQLAAQCAAATESGTQRRTPGPACATRRLALRIA